MCLWGRMVGVQNFAAFTADAPSNGGNKQFPTPRSMSLHCAEKPLLPGSC